MRSMPVAFFLACSWFWCIGGFFPVLLQQEFGRIAFLCFLILNVAGATLFASASLSVTGCLRSSSPCW